MLICRNTQINPDTNLHALQCFLSLPLNLTARQAAQPSTSRKRIAVRMSLSLRNSKGLSYILRRRDVRCGAQMRGVDDGEALSCCEHGGHCPRGWQLQLLYRRDSKRR
jgi:hypothetical protein